MEEGSSSSSTLSSTKAGCDSCATGSRALSKEEIEREMESLRSSAKWLLSEDLKSISRSFVCRNWKAAITGIEAVSEVAENPEMNHHPDLHLTNYRDLTITIFTHAVNGLTEFDFKLARAIDQISFDYSPKWLKENPQT